MSLEKEFEYWAEESLSIAEEAFACWLFDIMKAEEEQEDSYGLGYAKTHTRTSYEI
jgi:hypothetical protein